MSTPNIKLELIMLSFSKFEFSIDLGDAKEIGLDVTKKADCLFSKDLSLKRAMVVLEFCVNSIEKDAFVFNSIAQVEIQLDEMPKDNIAAFQENVLVPFADKIVTEKVKELTGMLGHGPIDLSEHD